MDELDLLKNIANRYERFVVDYFDDEFYTSDDYDHYENIKESMTKQLEFIDYGACCEVFRKKKYVLKLHTPYKEKITLLDNPGYNIKLTPYEDKSAKFLYYEHVTWKGFAAVQKFVDCSDKAQQEAFSLYKKLGYEPPSTTKNLGLHNGEPVCIDWF